MNRVRVVIESPLSGNFQRNIRYARLCMIDCMRRDEAPYASHLLLTQVLDDMSPEERKRGMEIGFAWGAVGELAAVYQDLGISGGMKQGIALHEKNGIPVVYRVLAQDLMAKLDDGSVLNMTEGMVQVTKGEAWEHILRVLDDSVRSGVPYEGMASILTNWMAAVTITDRGPSALPGTPS